MADQMNEPVKTFSIGFRDADFDEVRFARLVAQRFGTDHHEFVVEPRALEIMPRLVRHYGEPFADASAIPSFYLAELTRRHVTVALTGDGGDERFAGYNRYVGGGITDRLATLPPAMRRMSPPWPPAIRSASRGSFADRLGDWVGPGFCSPHGLYAALCRSSTRA